MRIVILTPVPFWHPGTRELMKRLNALGNNIVALDIWKLKSCDVTGNESDLKGLKTKGFIDRLINKVLRKKVISAFLKDYDILDIHWCDPNYTKYLTTLRKKKTKIISTVFGSDFYRIDKEKLHSLQILLEESDRISIGVNMKADFFSAFPHVREKTVFNQYGSERLDFIKNAIKKNRSEIRHQWGVGEDDIVTTVGYNAKKEQQHNVFIDILKSFPKSILQKIVLLFPLTYGMDEHPDYFQSLTDSINNIPVKKSIILNQKLTDQEMAETKIISDITMNLQTTDALSSSVKEAFAAGNVVIAGRWLPYQIYEEIGLFFHRTEISGIKDIFLHVISELDIEKRKCSLNGELIYKFASWSSVLPEFTKTYIELTNEWN